MWTPRVVDSVSATFRRAPRPAPRRSPRTRSRRSSIASKYARPPRPCSASHARSFATSLRASAGRAARTCPRSGTRTGRARGSARARPRPRHRDLDFDRRMVGEEAAVDAAALGRPARAAATARAADEDLVDPGAGAREPPLRRTRSRSVARLARQPQVEVAREHDDVVRLRDRRRERRGAQQLDVGEPRGPAKLVQCRFATRTCARRRHRAGRSGRPALLRPRKPCDRAEVEPSAPLRRGSGAGSAIETACARTAVGPRRGSRFPGPRRPSGAGRGGVR